MKASALDLFPFLSPAMRPCGGRGRACYIVHIHRKGRHLESIRLCARCADLMTVMGAKAKLQKRGIEVSIEGIPEGEVVQDAARELGSAGGSARAKAITPERRHEIAQKAADRRWHHA